MKRLFDLILSILLLIIFMIPMILISFLIMFSSKGPILYFSDRVGRDNNFFKMPKFRTMHSMSPNIASNLLKNPENYLTNIGSFLRKSSLDEIPQIISVLKGDMSIVGPRPALFNQYDLIKLRTESSIDQLLPGVTGWAQVNGRDELSIPDKVTLDVEYLNRKSFWFDMKILWMTFLKVMKRDGVSH